MFDKSCVLLNVQGIRGGGHDIIGFSNHGSKNRSEWDSRASARASATGWEIASGTGWESETRSDSESVRLRMRPGQVQRRRLPRRLDNLGELVAPAHAVRVVVGNGLEIYRRIVAVVNVAPRQRRRDVAELAALGLSRAHHDDLVDAVVA